MFNPVRSFAALISLFARGAVPLAFAVAPLQARLPARALPVPLFVQRTNYSCGAASFRSVIAYWGIQVATESQLYPQLGTTPRDGTEPMAILAAASLYGLRARLQENTTLATLRSSLERGVPAIIALQAWRDEESLSQPWEKEWDSGHYVVAVAMDETYLYVADPSTEGRYAFLPLAELEKRWHDVSGAGSTLRRWIHLAIFVDRPGAQPLSPEPLERLN